MVETLTSADTDRDRALAALVARIAGRDERALEALYEQLLGRAYGLALRIVGNAALAEEVVEDTFFQIWREAARYDIGRGRVITWVLTICRSRALDALRRADEAEPIDDVDSLRADQESAFADPAVVLQQFETGSEVQRALAQLPARERQAVALAFFRGMTHQEIADAWAMPLGSVKTLMHRAFGQLRECLGPQHGY